MTNSPTPATHSSDATHTSSETVRVLRLELNGYVPMSHNRARGAHWTVMHREKQKALLFLRISLMIDTESGSQSTRFGPATGTTTAPSRYRIALSRLDSCQTTTGKFLKAKSGRAKPRAKRKSGQ